MSRLDKYKALKEEKSVQENVGVTISGVTDRIGTGSRAEQFERPVSKRYQTQEGGVHQNQRLGGDGRDSASLDDFGEDDADFKLSTDHHGSMHNLPANSSR